MFSNELDKLLILNIGDLDEGARRFELLQIRVADEIDKLVQDWATRQGWRSAHSWREEEDAAVAPHHWMSGDSWQAWFGLEYRSGDTGEWSDGNDYFWLTKLCAEGRGGMGFRFCQDQFPKTAWKKFIQTRAIGFNDTRFVFDDEPSLFLPIRVDKETLAKGAEEEKFEEALRPLNDALDYIHSIIDRFESLLTTMRNQQAS
ncbi:hypothetical protein [Pseudorhizobium flavum]|uniref:Uncharacterized protein n=1 Tax=Pseudorhizobium flavum TaxID=1335061 RepID=A0A7W9Z1M4_9HYPH|nr:hypothetical protein [Pseudorhizobium flavum]MBB6182385.1 hypothetical protein [Pseudorhizobium flavum]CAD6602615.1 hypothetical protein RFYW14_01171 [Pseudorhizobium flavum]